MEIHKYKCSNCLEINGFLTPVHSFECKKCSIVNCKDMLVVTASGASSSHCPDLAQIPLEALLAIAGRFELGEKKHGRDDWRQGTGNKDYVLNRINHVIKHCYHLINQIEGREDITNRDTPEGNIGAIAWGGATLSVMAPPLFKDPPCE